MNSRTTLPKIHPVILCALVAIAPTAAVAQTNVVLNGTTGTNTVSTTYVTDGGLNLSLGLGVEYLIVGGGGGGGNTFAGGGGAGGLLQGSVTVGAGDFAVQVGAGGAAGANGTNSSWNNLTSIGGGAGGGLTGAGSVGGSGGGAGGRSNANGGSGTSGQGNRGGNEVAGDFDGGAGGGGAGGVGANNATQRGGNGGAGVQSAITGANTFYAAGGGGGGYAGQTAGTGGSGIGGNGATTTPATSGAAGTGSGGGGGGGGTGASFGGASGGSGVVILRYLGGPLATGGTISSGTGSAAGYTLHTFNSTGSNSFDLSSSSLNGRLGATLTGNLIGSGAVTYNGPGTLTLAADNRLYNGTTKITGGTINVSNAYGLGNGAVELLTPGTALTFSTGISNYFLSRGISTAAGTSMDLNGTVNITGDNSATTIASDISGGGRLSLSSGLYTLSGSNSFTGGIIINSGKLIALNPAAFSSGPITSTASTAGVSFATSTTLTNDMNWLGFGGDITVDSGNAVTLAGKINVAQNFLFKAGGGTLEITSTEGNEFGDGITVIEGRLRGTAATLSTLLVNDGEVEFNQTNNGIVTRSIRGTGKLIKTGEGTLSFSPLFGGTTTFTGGTEVQDGRLQLSGASFPGNVNVSSNAVLEFIAGGAFRGVISGDGEVVKTGPTSLLLAGSSTYTGTTTIQQGLVVTDGLNRLPTVGNVIVESGAELRLGGDQTLASVAGAGGLRIDTSLTTGSISSDFSGSVFGVGSLTKAGVGTFTLSGSNSFTGDTFVNGGRLVLGSSNALGGASVVKVNTGGTLEATQRVVIGFLDLDGGTVIGSNNLVSALTLINSGTVSGLADGPDFAAGILKRTAGEATVDGANTFTGTVKIDAGTVRMVSGGSFDSASSLYVQDGATLDLNGIDQTFSVVDGVGGSAVALGSGRLEVNGAADSDFGGVISGSGQLAKSGSGTLSLSGANTYSGGTLVSAGRLAGTTTSLQGTITNNASVEFAQSGNGTFSNVISGNGSVVKSGAGNVTLTGTNTYSGTTTVAGGGLVINGSIADSAVTVQSGGFLGGSGTVGSLTVESGGTVGHGNSPGTLNINGDINWLGGGSYNWQIVAATGAAGTGWDLQVATGQLDLSSLTASSQFNINLWSLESTGPDVSGALLDFNPNQTYTWTIVTASNGITGFSADKFNINLAAVNGTDGFANALADGWGFSVVTNGNNLNLLYAQQIGPEPIPEPGTWAAAALLAGGAAFMRWRKRAKVS